MSTRANIIITNSTDGFNESLWFYRHSDGYPEGTLPTLKKLIRWVQTRRVRDNVGQTAGWLIIIGNTEYKVGNTPGNDVHISGWKVGAYEPTTGEHGDIEWKYTVDLGTLSIRYTNIYTGETWVWSAKAKRTKKVTSLPAKVW